jgi:hypothetical protein
LPELIITVNKGILKDYGPRSLPAGYGLDGRHVRFRDGTCQKMKGRTVYYDTADSNWINGLFAFKTAAGAVYVLSGTKTTMAKIIAGTKTNLKINYTGYDTETGTQDATPWSFCAFGDVIIFTNGIDNVQKFVSPYNAVADLGGIPPKANVAKAFARHVMLLGLPNYPKRVAWSDIDNYEIWTPAPGNEAGDYDFYECETPLIGGDALGDFFIVYALDQIFAMQYIGGTLVFATRSIAKEKGLWKKHLLATIGNAHFFMSRDNFYVFDGTQPTPIGEGIKYDVFASINKSQISKAFVFPVTEEGEVWFVLPTGVSGYPNLACIYNYRNGSWTFEDLEMWAAVDRHPTSYPIYSSFDKKICNLGITENDPDGNAITGYIDSDEYDLGVFDRYKAISRLMPLVRSRASVLKFRIGQRNRLDDPVIWSGAYNFNPSVDWKLDIRVNAKYFRFRIYTDTVDSPFKFDGMKVIYEVTHGR